MSNEVKNRHYKNVTGAAKEIGKLPFFKWFLRQILKLFRYSTNYLRILPDFIIIGTQRGGTTSLYKYIAEHPNVYSAFRKEVDFFDYNYNKGISWYKAHFPTFLKRFCKERIKGQRFITGESSPEYMFHPHSLKRLNEKIPQVKIICMLRNPADRAYSSYNLIKKLGIEKLSFEEAIKKEKERLNGELEKMIDDENYQSFNRFYYSYLSRGEYFGQIETIYKYFPKEQVLILKSEDFYENPPEILNQVYEFLNLPYWELKKFKRYNYIKAEGLKPDIRKKLVKYYELYNKKLYELLGCDFDWK